MYGGFGWIYGYPKASECHIYRPLNHRVWEERERTERERENRGSFFLLHFFENKDPYEGRGPYKWLEGKSRL